MNQFIISKERDGYYPTKDSFFNILSLTDQLYRSRSTYLEGSKYSNIYFSEKHVLDLIKLGLKYLSHIVKAFKEAI